MARIKEIWTSTHALCTASHAILERVNKDFKLMLYAWLKDVKKEYNRWVSELPCIQYCKNTAHHGGIRGTPYCVHFGRAPADLSVDLTLPKEVVERLEIKDELYEVLKSRQVIGYASFDPSPPTGLRMIDTTCSNYFTLYFRNGES